MRLYCEAERRFIYENPIPAATGIVTNEAGEILLIRRNRQPGKNLWALPGGFIEMKESPADAARREIEEECGIACHEPSLVDIIYQESAFFGGSILIIGYSFASFDGKLRAGDDAEEARFYSLDDLPRLAFESHGRMIRRFLARRDELRRLWSEGI
ncbi:MAG: NUDIX hydrolase [Candidatus Krumholzibacteria bacterium]|nr:NUDIX hydrolase [Candidatus Krumholzibacteria bacterium]